MFFARTLSGTVAMVSLSLSALCACGTDESNDFGNGAGNANKGGNSASTSSGGTGGKSASGTNSGGNPIVGTGAGVTEPESTVDDPDTYQSSCEAEKCTSDEGCFETCPSGSCCVHACEGQTGSTSGEVACCDRQGGIVPGASCAS
jgi:hypothetical protein